MTPCQTCNIERCIDCMRKWHEGETCEEVNQRLKEEERQAAEEVKRELEMAEARRRLARDPACKPNTPEWNEIQQLKA